MYEGGDSAYVLSPGVCLRTNNFYNRKFVVKFVATPRYFILEFLEDKKLVTEERVLAG